TMRREGFELAVGRPRVLFQNDSITGQRLEPIEEVVIDVDDAYTGVVVEQISVRKGELQDMRPSGAGKTRLVFYAPSRGLIGYHSRGNDLDVNVLKGKQLTNIRAAGKDEAVRLTPPRRMSLEQAIAYIEDDELVEVTPKSIRLRKRFLNPEDRKRAKKQAAAA